MKASLTFLLLLLGLISTSQTVTQKLSAAVKKMEADSSMKHGIVSLYVINNKTGKVIYDKNSQIGLPAGSTQKVITSVTAFELLGKDYRYKTEVRYVKGLDTNDRLRSRLSVFGSGDPTFGSWRFKTTSTVNIFQGIKDSIIAKGISRIDGQILEKRYELEENIPDGWIWQDIGNYYGAAAHELNWNENQYDVILTPHKDGYWVEIYRTEPQNIIGLNLYSRVHVGAERSGDNTNIYWPSSNKFAYIIGTIPKDEKYFKISGSLPQPANQLKQDLTKYLIESGIVITDSSFLFKRTPIPSGELVFTHVSPSLDSINFWFLQKSINLYGEAFLITISKEEKGCYRSDSGVAVIKDFWSKRGIDKSALNIKDGSGLSPANRITANALVTVLNYAKTKPWFSSFYDALPYVNGFKMKSGTIGDVLAYTGYIGDYTFSIIVNNYDGKARDMREKMLTLLDNLK
jgi:serine-type D-Ala-D-Ala carboxypeptidase/endopeptidase (penicillin-binding protein 4)